MTRLGKLPVQYKAGLRYWADSPEGWGFKLAKKCYFISVSVFVRQ